MRHPVIWGAPETAYLRRFFDCVDVAVTEEMQAASALLEDNLTFLLCRLLDGESTFQRILTYPLKRLNEELAGCGTGTQIAIDFETNEHKRSFEGAVSHADLGIVLRRDHSIFGPAYTKAVVVQSKKLYRHKDVYRLDSGYDGFDKNQFTRLKAIASKYDRNGVFYFLYNPMLEAFNERDAEILKALEVRLLAAGQLPCLEAPAWHPDIENYFRKMNRHGLIPPFYLSMADLPSANELRDRRMQLVSQKPGLRVLGLTSVATMVESNGFVKNTFRLKECYEYALSGRWCGILGAVPFLPLSAFIVNMLMACTHGSDNENIVRIAEGKEPDGDARNDDGNGHGVAVRHTLRITVRSTLPETNIMFHQ